MSKKNLKDYFPVIRTREEVVNEIQTNPKLKRIYEEHPPEEWEEFIDFCTGVRGVKMLYDSFFKEVFNPEYAPERLGKLLSIILGQKVKILQVLPNDSTRISDESALLVTDIVVELEDRSIVNVEVQKIGYMFPGERAACYSADLLLRQYKRIRDEKKKLFTYTYIKPVYTIVLFETSPSEFKRFGKEYFHHVRHQSDTGMEIELLQEYYFICLDLFKEKLQNEGVTCDRDAWLAFLCEDDPDVVIDLITKYPEFKPLYEEVYRLCLNMEDVMGLFSEELRVLDRNTAQFMIDEMQKEVDKYKFLSQEQGEQIVQKDEQIARLKEKLKKYEEINEK